MIIFLSGSMYLLSCRTFSLYTWSSCMPIGLLLGATGVLSELLGLGTVPTEFCAHPVIPWQLGDGANAGEGTIWLLGGWALRPAGDCTEGVGLCRRNCVGVGFRGNPALGAFIIMPSPGFRWICCMWLSIWPDIWPCIWPPIGLFMLPCMVLPSWFCSCGGNWPRNEFNDLVNEMYLVSFTCNIDSSNFPY